MDVELEELTPAGRGAVSVVRLRGAGAEPFVRELCGGAAIPDGEPRLARLRLAGEELDEALVCRLPGGGIELHLHGSPVLLRRFAELVPAGPTEAQPAESLEALAECALRTAPAECAARILLDQAEGALARELRALAAADAPSRERSIEALLARWRVARFALRPAEVVLAGPANAGKSTLFNALLGEDRAIVDPAPGTTRDVLRERARLGAWPVRLVDTAGERALAEDEVERPDEVELEGQTRGRRVRAGADLVFQLEPWSPSATGAPAPDARTAVVRTFADRAADPSAARGAISALRDPAGARTRVAAIFRDFFALPEDPWIPGQGVPFSAGIAEAIAGLRGAPRAELERRVTEILEVAPSAPPS